MAAYPTCVRCLSADSEVDVAGVCTTCKSRGSRETPVATAPKPSAPKPMPVEPGITKTEPKADAPTATDPGEGGSTLATPVPVVPPPTPKTFSHFVDLEYLDAGGMGYVYKARDTRTDRVVALKLMKGVALGDSRLRARFLTEGKALARLAHPGVVQVFEVDEWDGTPFIAMEYVPGGSLAKRLRTGDRPTPVEAARLMAEVASAVAAAHDKKILHRDIKPGNILLTDAGRPKLADFGLASLIDETTRMTNPGGVLGTPAFMPPEHAAGRFGDIGPRSDVYGLGATLYDVLTGKPPFTGENAFQVIERVCRDDAVPPRKLNADVTPDLERVVLRCLEKRQADRYESAAALATDLMRVVRGEPIGKVSVVWYVRRFVRRNGKVMGAVLAVVLFTCLIALIQKPPKPVAQGSEPLNPDARAEAFKAEMARKLKEGQSVEITESTGLPHWSNRFIGDAKLTARDYFGGDKCAWFDATMTTLMELCEDTQSDRYVVEAEIQHVENRKFEGRVGLYFRGRDQSDVIRWTVVMFSDFPVAPAQAPKAASELGLRVQDRIFVTLPALFHINGNENSKRHPFPPANNKEGNPWRRLQMEISKDGLAGHWEVDGTMTPVIRKTAKQFRDSDNELQKLLNMHSPGRGVPPWEPRSAVGIFAENATVAFRSFRITPAPAP